MSAKVHVSCSKRNPLCLVDLTDAIQSKQDLVSVKLYLEHILKKHPGPEMRWAWAPEYASWHGEGKSAVTLSGGRTLETKTMRRTHGAKLYYTIVTLRGKYYAPYVSYESPTFDHHHTIVINEMLKVVNQELRGEFKLL